MRIDSQDHIVVTGASGFLGRHLMPVLQSAYPQTRITGLSSSDADLISADLVAQVFDRLQPTVVIHLAAYSGGIEANRTYPADFFHRNLILMENVFHACAIRKVRKLVYPMGGCSYPNTAESPIDESQMWQGYPVGTSAGYSMAKKMGIVASEVYWQQYGLPSVVLVPGNMYGEYDNYHSNNSHVIPGLIRRFYEARQAGQASVTMWGTGKPTRDFVYAGDVAAVFPFFLDNDETVGPVNISSGVSTHISHLASLVAQLSGYEGKLVWDTSKPDGQMVKVFDVGRLHALGLRCPTPLQIGLELTIRWFAGNYRIPGAVRL
jgi:GDP-L-fucose synthase